MLQLAATRMLCLQQNTYVHTKIVPRQSLDPDDKPNTSEQSESIDLSFVANREPRRPGVIFGPFHFV